jgi:hypothetical protein
MSLLHFILMIAFGAILTLSNQLIMRALVTASRRDAIIGFTGSTGVIVIALVLGIYGESLFKFLSDVIGLHGAQGVAAVTVIALGSLASYFKKKELLWYGTVEVFFGVVTAVKVASGLTPGEILLSQWTALVAAAYIVARGLNNISDARAQAFARFRVTPQPVSLDA